MLPRVLRRAAGIRLLCFVLAASAAARAGAAPVSGADCGETVLHCVFSVPSDLIGWTDAHQNRPRNRTGTGCRQRSSRRSNSLRPDLRPRTGDSGGQFSRPDHAGRHPAQAGGVGPSPSCCPPGPPRGTPAARSGGAGTAGSWFGTMCGTQGNCCPPPRPGFLKTFLRVSHQPGPA